MIEGGCHVDICSPIHGLAHAVRCVATEQTELYNCSEHIVYTYVSA